jgi:hypothetical protein
MSHTLGGGRTVVVVVHNEGNHISAPLAIHSTPERLQSTLPLTVTFGLRSFNQTRREQAYPAAAMGAKLPQIRSKFAARAAEGNPVTRDEFDGPTAATGEPPRTNGRQTAAWFDRRTMMGAGRSSGRAPFLVLRAFRRVFVNGVPFLIGYIGDAVRFASTTATIWTSRTAPRRR